jgi:hypothetical protein
VKHFRSFGLWMVLLLLSCESQEDNYPIFTDSEYFPLESGFYHLYDVTEVRYALSVPETLQYELKVLVLDSFKNGTGELSYVLKRSKRTDVNAEWTPLETWSAQLNQNEVIVSEGNIPYVVLDFPLVEKKSWDGNKYNNQTNPVSGENDDSYDLIQVDEPFDINGSSFPDCVTVSQEDNQEFIVYFDRRYEVYSRHVGLISKNITQLKYCNDADRNCIGQQIVDEGVIYQQTLKQYGKE